MSNTIAKDRSLRYRARRVSQGVKHKLKNLFGLSKDDNDDTGLPMQHIDAQRSHIFGFGISQRDTDDESHRVSSAGRAALSYVASGVPSLHDVPSYQQLHSRQGSMESLPSEREASDDRSRVTSWSNSETNTVITHNSLHEPKERKRLSIINEHGAHVCSSSAQFASISEDSNTSSASLPRPVQAPPMKVDSRRIYSALMKRMDKSQQECTSNPERESSNESTVQSETVPPPKSSLRPRPVGYNAPTTIRYVIPESESESEYPETTDNLHKKENQGSQLAYKRKASLSIANRAREERQGHLASAPNFTDAGDGQSNDINKNVHSIHSIHETPPLVQSLSARSSAFFGSPTRHLFRTQSPFRRVLQDRMQTAPNEQQTTPSDFNPWMRSLSNLPNLPMRRSSTYGSDADIKLHYTESIYSTNTDDGQTKRQSILSAVEDMQRPTSTHGDATIFLSPSEYNKRSLSLPPKQRISSSSSSVEWKMWLSSNVSKLEETTTQVDANDFQSGLASTRSSGHVRENAQINDEDEDKVTKPPAIPQRAQATTSSYVDLNLDDDNDDNIDDDQPTPFDAGDTQTPIRPPKPPYASSLPASVSALSIPSSAKTDISAGVFGTRREKELPRVPSLGFKGINSSGHSSITKKLRKRQPKPKDCATPLTNRVMSSSGGDQSGKMSNQTSSRRKMDSMTSAKAENVSPAAAGEDDPYGIEGSGVLGPNQQGVGGKRMVDIFLSSRRRRMMSDDEGSVFL
ncbi:hypothetical protein F4802DRAFT_575964 [Xylaria palmicola]|nr:hypothetical protein F4802DRAFT_575964 [Xylaria palmicola]